MAIDLRWAVFGRSASESRTDNVTRDGGLGPTRIECDWAAGEHGP